MSNTLRNNAIAGNTQVIDTFLNLSKVYLAGFERLSALNLNGARESVDDCAAAARTLSEAGPGSDLSNVLSVLGQPMWQKALTHWRSTYELIATTHEEMSKVINEQLAQQNMAFAGLTGWSAMSDVFSKGVQQITASATQNMAAAADARSRAVAVTATDVKKVA